MKACKKLAGLAALLASFMTGPARAQPEVPIGNVSAAYHLSLKCDDKPVMLEEIIPNMTKRATMQPSQQCSLLGAHPGDTLQKVEFKTISPLAPIPLPAPDASYVREQIAPNELAFEIREEGEYALYVSLLTENSERQQERQVLELKVTKTGTPESRQVEKREEEQRTERDQKVYGALELGLFPRSITSTRNPRDQSIVVDTINYRTRMSIEGRVNGFYARFTPALSIKTPTTNAERYTAVNGGALLELRGKQFDLALAYYFDDHNEIVQALTGKNIGVHFLAGQVEIPFGEYIRLKFGGDFSTGKHEEVDPATNAVDKTEVNGFSGYLGGSLRLARIFEAGARIDHTLDIIGDHYTTLAVEAAGKFGPADIRAVGYIGQTAGVEVNGGWNILPQLRLSVGVRKLDADGAKSNMSDLSGYVTARLSHPLL